VARLRYNFEKPKDFLLSFKIQQNAIKSVWLGMNLLLVPSCSGSFFQKIDFKNINPENNDNNAIKHTKAKLI